MPELSGPSTSSVRGMRNIRVLIVDDVDALLVTMSRLFRACGDIDVVGTAKNGLEAVTNARELGPDVIIMDVRMPKMDGLEAAGYIKRASSDVGILFVSASDEYREASVAVGGDGYLTKPFKREELLREVKSIAARQALCSGGQRHQQT